MNTKYIKIVICFISALLLSCTDEKLDPVGSVKNEIAITNPANNTTFTTSPNQTAATAFNLKWTPADFGFSSAVSYTLEIVYNGVTQTISLGSFNENAGVERAYLLTNKALNDKLFVLGAPEGQISSFKIRVKASPVGQVATAANALIVYTPFVTFTSNVYNPIYEAEKIFVFGNFGAASTFADWSISTTGANNSPLLYSQNNDGIYEGFIYMNNASPQFKFAKPDATSLNVKGLNTVFNSLFYDFTGSPMPVTTFGNSVPGTLKASTEATTTDVISPLSPAAATYFVRVDWNTNQYAVAKRSIAITGICTGNVHKFLTYETNPSSPYYRQYVNNNVTLAAGAGTIRLKYETTGFALGSRLELMGGEASNQNLLISPNANSSIKNPLKLGSLPFNVTTPGSFTVVVDLNHSKNYNLRIIPN